MPRVEWDPVGPGPSTRVGRLIDRLIESGDRINRRINEVEVLEQRAREWIECKESGRKINGTGATVIINLAEVTLFRLWMFQFSDLMSYLSKHGSQGELEVVGGSEGEQYIAFAMKELVFDILDKDPTSIHDFPLTPYDIAYASDPKNQDLPFAQAIRQHPEYANAVKENR